jgi:sugar transferase (PEP-CTERM/EpsH1 system associated)
MQKLSVLQITHDLNIGGLQRVVVDLSRSLDKDKYDVSVCALREGGPLESELKKEGIKVIKLPLAENGIDYFTFWKLYKIFREIRPAVIHTHNTQPFIEGAIAALMARVPVIVHTDHGRQFPDKRRYMFSEWVLSHFADQIVAVSETTKSGLVHYEKVSSSKIQVILNGIDEQKYSVRIDKDKKKKELGIVPNAGPILGWCGRLSPEKGLTYLIKAMELLRRGFPNILLLIAGAGALKEDLNRQAKDLGLERHVRFLGPRADVHEILMILDLFVLPSVREGLPLVLLEAMAAGVPIVATDVGGNHRAVQEAINGFLVKPGDPDSLYKAIKGLLENRKLRETFSRNALALFQKEFTLKKMVQEYELVYQECLASVGIGSEA